jgi:MFS family permease
MAKAKRSYFSGLTRETFLLATSSLFSDISTEMLYPILPIFITQILKDSPAIVGIIEGAATAVQYIIQGFSGWLADKFQRKKSIALFGYGLTALSKPFIGFSTIWQEALLGRLSDRLGAGTRSAPRDALIAQSASDANRGKAFGLEGIGDNLGACIGPLIAIFLLYSLHINLRSIFYLAFIPGVLAFLMIFFVHEKKVIDEKKVALRFSFAAFPATYWKYLFVTALFGLGNSSNSFLILQAQRLGIPLSITILIYAGFNFVAALSSFPAGTLSDRVGRKKLLLSGFLIFALTYLGFGISTNLVLIGFLFLFYGMYSGIYRAVGKAFATDAVAPAFRATAIGIYSSVVGLTSFFASFIGGQLWVNVSPAMTFLWGVGFAAIALIASYFLLPKAIQTK